jgi:hypothetical protein
MPIFGGYSILRSGEGYSGELLGADAVRDEKGQGVTSVPLEAFMTEACFATQLLSAERPAAEFPLHSADSPKSWPLAVAAGLIPRFASMNFAGISPGFEPVYAYIKRFVAEKAEEPSI